MKLSPRLYRFGLSYPRAVFITCLVLTAVALAASTRLSIQNDLVALLPKDFESVEAFREIRDYFGGFGYLVVTVEHRDPNTAERFADTFVKKVEKLPAVQYVDYRRPIDFFNQRKWLYLDLEDLEEMERRLDRSLELQKKGVSPLFNSLMFVADEEEKPDLTFEDIRKKFEEKRGIEVKSLTTTDEGKFIVFKVKSKVHQQNLDKGAELVSSIQKVEGEMKQEKGFEDILVRYTGDHVQALDSFHYIKQKMAVVSIVVVALLFLILFGYFRKFKAIYLIGIPLIMGIVWTGGLILLLIGHLNIITGFAVGILAGLGSDYGIYLVSRYHQERKAGVSFLESCRKAFQNTGRATYSSMLTTVGAFLALLFSDFEVTRELGIIGALGLVMNYLAMMLVIPSLLALVEKYRPREKTYSGRRRMLSKIESAFSMLLAPKAPRAIIGIVLILSFASVFSFPWMREIRFEDGRLEHIATPQDHLYQKVASLYEGTLQPTVLITHGDLEDEKTVETFEESLKSDSDKNLPFRNVLGLSSFVPKQQDEKRQILSRLAVKFRQSNFPPKEERFELIESFQSAVKVEPVTVTTLPNEVTRKFQSPLQEDVRAVYLFPDFKDLNWEWMKRYSETVNGMKKLKGLHFKAGDNPFLATEFVRMIEREAPRMILTTLLILLLILLLLVRPVLQSLVIFAHILSGLALLSGALWIFGVEMNTLNVIALPIILGTGIDSFIHFTLRYRELFDMAATIRDKLPSILVSNLTTVIGFGGLLFVPSEGLKSLGYVVLLGLGIMTLLCAVILPRVLVLHRQKGIA